MTNEKQTNEKTEKNAPESVGEINLSFEDFLVLRKMFSLEETTRGFLCSDNYLLFVISPFDRVYKMLIDSGNWREGGKSFESNFTRTLSHKNDITEAFFWQDSRPSSKYLESGVSEIGIHPCFSRHTDREIEQSMLEAFCEAALVLRQEGIPFFVYKKGTHIRDQNEDLHGINILSNCTEWDIGFGSREPGIEKYPIWSNWGDEK